MKNGLLYHSLYSFIILMLMSFSTQCSQALQKNNASRSPAKAGITQENEKNVTNKNVIDILQLRFPTFYSHLKRVGYAPMIESADNITIFAPTEEAFQYLIKDAIGGHAYRSIFFNNTERGLQRLKNILNLHIFPEKLLAKEIAERESLQPFNSRKSLEVNKVDHEIHIDSATVVNPDIIGTNGVVHAINAVLF